VGKGYGVKEKALLGWNNILKTASPYLIQITGILGVDAVALQPVLTISPGVDTAHGLASAVPGYLLQIPPG